MAPPMAIICTVRADRPREYPASGVSDSELATVIRTSSRERTVIAQEIPDSEAHIGRSAPERSDTHVKLRTPGR
ncbi:Uncharacterised protein [Mycobacteroides abscessus subsp. massiliense]|nr:Uncharacterised protein [Mycobacteroides abscessus subsp. massiliense]